MKGPIFWDVTPCSPADIYRRSSKISVHAKWRHILEESTFKVLVSSLIGAQNDAI
jgi:hypothetical protein